MSLFYKVKYVKRFMIYLLQIQKLWKGRKDFEHVGVVIDIFKGLLGLGMFRYWF